MVGLGIGVDKLHSMLLRGGRLAMQRTPSVFLVRCRYRTYSRYLGLPPCMRTKYCTSLYETFLNTITANCRLLLVTYE